MTVVLTDARLFTADARALGVIEDSTLVIGDDGRIEAVGARESVEIPAGAEAMRTGRNVYQHGHRVV